MNPQEPRAPSRAVGPPLSRSRLPPPNPDYPETDGEPIADSTLQFDYITKLTCNIDGLLAHDENVFVAGDLFWYPVKGDATIRTAPDTMVVFGRPKGHRRSYLQWQEGNIAPQVVVEVLSHIIRPGLLQFKFEFYERYGVEEYYLYDPNCGRLRGWLRQGNQLQEIPVMQGWISPRLGVRFELDGVNLVVFQRDGQRFLSYVELAVQLEASRKAREMAQHPALFASQQTATAQQEANAAHEQAAAGRKAAIEAQLRVNRLAAQLRALGIEPDA